MSRRGELCSCGQKAVLLGRCYECFGKLTQSFHTGQVTGSAAGCLRAGQRFAGGRFTLIHLLGEGGMGTVWLADDESLSRDGAPVQVALKFVGGDGQPDEELIRLLRKEVLAALRLSHPNLVRVHFWHEHQGEPVFYSMEFVAGLDLKRLLEQHPQGRFSCRELQPLLGQLVDALIYAHEQVRLVHRDLKPANILVTPEGQLKLADFGLARPDVAKDVLATTAGGTLCYASPQQRAGAAPSVSDDIYSLGAVLYHLLTGQLPYSLEELTSGETPAPPIHPWRIVSQSGGDRRSITAEAASTLLRCLSYNVEERPPDVRTFWKWWNSGPPAEEERISSGFLASTAKGLLGGTLLFLVLFLALGVAWRLGLDSILQTQVPRIAELGRIVKETIFPDTIVPPPPPPPPPPPRTDPSATNKPLAVATILQLELEGERSAEFELFQFSGVSNSWTPFYSGMLTGSTLVPIATSVPGAYRLEAGQGEKRTGTTWTQLDFSLTGGTNRISVDLRPSQFQLFLNQPIPFHVIDGWGNIVTKFEDSFFPYKSPPIREAPWSATLPRGLKLLAGTYRIIPEKGMAIAQHFEEEGTEFKLRPGAAGPVGVLLAPWRVPRLFSDWTNSLRIHLIPAPNNAPFLAASTETTVGQFSEFARDTNLNPSSIESITANGSKNIGRTWQNAVPGQTSDHPVVGISWHEAKAFCDWLTRREQSLGRLTEHQHYELPTSEQWATLAGNHAFPWHGTFPPTAMQGNYAGLEVRGADWPASWNGLVFDYEDRRSPRTVPVSSYPKSGLGFFDLGGNASEWCNSWYRKPPNAMAEWKVPSQRLANDLGGTVYRVVRGGSWFDHHDEDILRTRTEWAEKPDTRNDRIGFRVVLLEDKDTP